MATRTDIAKAIATETGVDLRTVMRRMAGCAVRIGSAKVVDEALARHGITAPESGVVLMGDSEALKMK